MTKIAIVGAGVMGSALCWPLSDNQHHIHLVGTHLDREIIRSCIENHFHPGLKRHLPVNVTPFYIEQISEALVADIDFIVSGVNSLGVHWIGKTLMPYLKPGQKIIAVTKGLQAARDGALRILPDVLRDGLPASLQKEVILAAIGGPCIAGELAGRRPSCVIFGCPNQRALDELARTFRTDYYHVWTTTDLNSLEICAGMKNAYAMAVGMAYGLLEKAGGLDSAQASMHNLAAAIFAQGCTEISCMLEAINADPRFAFRLPTPGDMYVTSTGGRSFTVGKLMGKGHSFNEAKDIIKEETLEAAYVVLQFAQAFKQKDSQCQIGRKELPLMGQLVDFIAEGKTVRFDLDAFFE